MASNKPTSSWTFTCPFGQEKANYVTCPKGHKIFVIWSDELQRFGFTCDECGVHALRAASAHGVIEVTVVGQGRYA